MREQTRQTPSGGAQVDAVAAIVQRLAVLLEAGVAPQSAWSYLPSGERVARGGRLSAAARRHAHIVETIARAISLGAPADAAIAVASRAADARTASAWRAVAAAWHVADESGAPNAPCLRDMAGSLRDIGHTQRTVDVALAAPIATTRLMTALPVVALGFGALLGFDTLHTLSATVPGFACLVAGSALLLLARLWNRRLVRAATPAAVTTGLGVELMAVAMGGGVSLASARRLTENTLLDFDLGEPDSMTVIDAIVELSHRAGVPAAELLRSEGRQLRREAQAAGQKVAAALSIRLMLPLGLCVLPAFMLLGVAPLLLAVISSTFASW
ncbi:hypothetical protein C5B96_09545 [Subtercola sp. Z020]|uniref:hypothetical protein n=1 Tax=Subtercola sp. Z020 TaxID=2080582 RepID=UPI000CE7C6AE|nr:hypothetical protein [Subtercola sp. Z020]PPF82188.1 hypothetical protein C5B96_09545 [Subtercola sp. Z020]